MINKMSGQLFFSQQQSYQKQPAAFPYRFVFMSVCVCDTTLKMYTQLCGIEQRRLLPHNMYIFAYFMIFFARSSRTPMYTMHILGGL